MKKYHDPLHIPYQEYTVVYKGQEMFMLNKQLLDRQNCWENLEKLKELHVEQLVVYEEMSNTDDELLLKMYDSLLDQINTELQREWKFTEDINYIQFWIRPKCTCPKLDNYDRYPYGYYVVNMTCPLHGE